MECPNCKVALSKQTRHGLQVEVCPSCSGMWMTPLELDQLENEGFSNEADKGSLFLVTRDTTLECPVCQTAMKQFDYRFYDLAVDFCTDHGFWLEKDEDDRILELMKGEEARVERDFGLEDKWASRMREWRSPGFFGKLKELL